ncbi:MAG: hypothetical protein KAT70_04035 [Thermoplasmata archaeon]|nr:hypothetical protein [Thermoplasmata archaeon]
MSNEEKPRATLLVKEDCQACSYVKEHIKDLPHVEERIRIVHGESAEGIMILADHEMVDGAPMPFLEVDEEYYAEGYKKAKDDKGKVILAAVRSKLVKKITEICNE